MLRLPLVPDRRAELHVSYDQDRALFRTTTARGLATSAVVAALGIAFLLNDRWLIIGIGIGVAVVGALGLQILTGFTGQVSLGHATFLAIGFYTVTALSPGSSDAIDGVLGGLPAPLSWVAGNGHGWPLILGLLAAGSMAALVGLVVGPSAFRLKGLYLAIVTMGLVFIGRHVFLNWDWLSGGPQGRAYTPPAIGAFSFGTDSQVLGITVGALQKQYLLVSVVALLSLWFVANLKRSRLGRALQAVRDQDVAAEVIGVPVGRYKLISFALSSFLGGVAGALFGLAIRYAVPESWDLFLSIKYIAMIIIGGGGALGALLGAVFVEVLPIGIQSLGGLEFAIISTFQLRQLLYGLAVIVFLVAEPSGLAGIWRNLRVYWRSWPFSY